MQRIVIPDKAFTYDGLFDWDRVFATALLLKINPDIEIERGPIIPPGYDGFVYSVKDHSFYNIFNDFAPVLGISEFTREDFGREFVLPLEKTPKGLRNPIAAFLEGYNPEWDAKEITDDKFEEAVFYAGVILDKSLDMSLARERVYGYMKEHTSDEIDAHLLALGRDVPWKDVMNNRFVIKNGDFKNINLVITPDKNGDFQIESVERNGRKKVQIPENEPTKYKTLEMALDAAEKIEERYDSVQRFVEGMIAVHQDAITGYIEETFVTVEKFKGFLDYNAPYFNLSKEDIASLGTAFEKIGKARMDGDELEVTFAELDFHKLFNQIVLEGVSPEIAFIRDSLGDGIPDREAWGDKNGTGIDDRYEQNVDRWAYRDDDQDGVRNKDDISPYINENYKDDDGDGRLNKDDINPFEYDEPEI